MYWAAGVPGAIQEFSACVTLIGAAGAVIPDTTWIGDPRAIDLVATCGRPLGFFVDSGATYAVGPSPAGLMPLACVGDCAPRRTLDEVVDARFIYFAHPDAGGVRRMSRAGGEARLLATGDMWDVAVDDVGVYATDVNGGQIRRIVK